jgi:outer membrane protein assembly factor BamA
MAAATATLLACSHPPPAPGSRWVRSFRIEGNSAFSDGELADKLATQKTGWWPFAGKRWLDQAAFDLDLKRIPAFYADHGFFDAKVADYKVKPLEGDAVDIVITVQENSPTQIGAVQVVGLPPDQEAPAHKLGASWNVVPGKRIDYPEYVGYKDKLGDRLKDEGYGYATVSGEIDVDRDHHRADVKLTTTPGPRVRFGKTTVEGNGKIPAYAILNRVTYDEGELFNPHSLATTQGRIYDLGVFASVRLQLPDTPQEVADVRIQVSPGPLREVRVGGGVGIERQREEVHLRLDYTINNFLGGLRKLRFRLKPAYVVIPSISDVQRRGPAAENEARLTQPDIFGSRISAHALAGYDVGLTQGYAFRGPRGQVGLSRPFFGDRVLAGGSWNLQYLTFYDVDEDIFNAATNRFYGFQNPYRLAYLEEFAQVDLRNHPGDPTFGGYLRLGTEQGSPLVGGAFHYVKFTPDVRAYVPLGRRVVVAGRAMVGWLKPWGGEESPVTRRYQLGGPSSHRGFSFGRLAPFATDNEGRRVPIGGDGEVLFSAELRVDVTKISGYWLGLVPFVDAGDVATRWSGLDLGNLHYASGVSLVYVTPIGAVRTGVGVRLNRMGGDNPDPSDRIAFHITIGEAF